MREGAEERRRRLNRIIKESFLCVIVGPPVGLILVLVLSALYGLVTPNGGSTSQVTNSLEIAGGLAYLFLAGFMISYLLGGVQAAFVGCCIGLYDWLMDELPMWLALLSGGVSCLFVVLIFGVRDMSEIGILMLVHILSAMVCWAMSRRLRRKLVNQ